MTTMIDMHYHNRAPVSIVFKDDHADRPARRLQRSEGNGSFNAVYFTNSK